MSVELNVELQYLVFTGQKIGQGTGGGGKGVIEGVFGCVLEGAL